MSFRNLPCQKSSILHGKNTISPATAVHVFTIIIPLARVIVNAFRVSKALDFALIILFVGDMDLTLAINSTTCLGEALHKELLRLAHKVKLLPRLGIVTGLDVLADLADLGDQLLRRAR